MSSLPKVRVYFELTYTASDQHRLIHTYNLETGEKVANFPFYKHLAQNPSIQMNLNLYVLKKLVGANTHMFFARVGMTSLT